MPSYCLRSGELRFGHPTPLALESKLNLETQERLSRYSIAFPNCGAAACRSAPLARLVLARILSEDMRDYDAALPYVQEAYGRYPLSWGYAKLAMEEAQGLGLKRPEARALAETLRAQWQGGWRPPAYAKMDPVPLFNAIDREKK